MNSDDDIKNDQFKDIKSYGKMQYIYKCFYLYDMIKRKN